MHRNHTLQAARLIAFAFTCLMLFTPSLRAGVYTQIDPYGANPRKIPDISGNPGDSITLAPDEVIDILILGDGYLNGEDAMFLDDGGTTGAQGWYNRIFGDSISEPGIRPFTMFSEAFRVRAYFVESSDRVDGPDIVDRTSYYRVKLDTAGKVSNDKWWEKANNLPNIEFRTRLFADIDALPQPKNLTAYPSTLDNSTNGEQTVSAMANHFSNLFVVLLAVSDGGCPSGRTFPVQELSGTRTVKVGVGCNTVHEFAHAFGYLRDEYITARDVAAPVSWINPDPDSMSIFNVSNMSYSNERCDLLWSHLAPGSVYNPKIRSMIGNLWVGGNKGELGQWHSEYKCLINGTHDNYTCDRDSPVLANLRDNYHFCFWCEELLSMRILQRTGEFDRLAAAPGDINTRGRAWYAAWEATLRDDFYTLFRYDSLISVKNRCYGLYSPSNGCTSCQNECDDNPRPICLPNCEIRDIGNAVYSHPDGLITNSGSRFGPLPTLLMAIGKAQLMCPETPIVVVRDGVHPGAITITTPLFLMNDECASALVGK